MRVASIAEVERFYDTLVDMPMVAFCDEDDEGIYFVGGLAWADGACWGFFDVKRKSGNAGAKLIEGVRKSLKVAKSLGERQVYVVRDKSHETSERVLKLFGFEPYLEDQGVWMCRV